MIKLSDMRCRVIIQKAVVITDELGGRHNSYTFYCTRWAQVNMVTGSERYEAAHTAEYKMMYFTIRCDSLTKVITPGQYRIVFQDKVYDIKAIDNYKFRNESLRITAEVTEDD